MTGDNSKGKRPIGRQEDEGEDAELLVQVGQLFSTWFSGDLREAITKVSTEFLSDKDRRNEFIKTLTKAPPTAKTVKTTPVPVPEEAPEETKQVTTEASTSTTTTEQTTSTRFRYKVNRNKNKMRNSTPALEFDSEIYSLNATDLLL